MLVLAIPFLILNWLGFTEHCTNERKPGSRTRVEVCTQGGQTTTRGDGRTVTTGDQWKPWRFVIVLGIPAGLITFAVAAAAVDTASTSRVNTEEPTSHRTSWTTDSGTRVNVSVNDISTANPNRPPNSTRNIDGVHPGDLIVAQTGVVVRGIVEGDVVLQNGSVLVKGTVNGDVVVHAGAARVSGVVQGDLVAHGGSVRISGIVNGSIKRLGGAVLD